MTSRPRFTLGLDTLLECHPDWLMNRRIGLVSHVAAVDRQGVPSATKLQESPALTLTALFGPEHGFAGLAAAGELTHDGHHPDWGIPIFSLYGETRKPTPAMLEPVDTLIVEFQDLGARPYTYVSTLRLVLEAAAETGKTVIIADRPIPLPVGTDGPLLDPRFETFVGLIPAPMQYGMTPGETAHWLTQALGLDVDLKIAAMRGYQRETERQPDWPPWVPPSPRIRSWESAALFTCTVFGEALTALDYGSGTPLAFQVVGAPWLDARQVAEGLAASGLAGITTVPHRYEARTGLYAGTRLDGLRLVVTDHAAFRPVQTCVTLLDIIQQIHGCDKVWTAPGSRPEWFDKLFGTDTVRLSLQAGTSARDIIASWQPNLSGFRSVREKHLLYPES